MHKQSCDRKMFGKCEQRQLIDLRGCSLLFATKKSSFLRFFFYKTPSANTQQVVPVQTGSYRYDE